jgi:hypothetical protein
MMEKRKEHKRDIRKIIIIICEGSDTEIIYFNEFNNNGNILVRPLFCGVTDIKNILKEAKKQMKKHQLDFEYGDQIWCAFDMDDKRSEDIRNCYDNATTEGINFAFSNPNIELWFLLHFIYHDGRLTKESTIELLKRSNRIPNYTKDMNVYPLLCDKIHDAINNAKRLNIIHLDLGRNLFSGDSNPSTQIFSLVELLLQEQ